MAISERDIKLLWGRAAGRCSNPSCRSVISNTTETGESYLTGEMAHIIARNLGGPRADGRGGLDTYDNLLLLCPSCHTMIDKAPEGTFSVEQLTDWKRTHEAWVENWGNSKPFQDSYKLIAYISELLRDNHHCFTQFGPKSELADRNPIASAHAIWVARKLDTIIPNNRRIIHALENNHDLIPQVLREPSLRFRQHALGFEQNQYTRMEEYPLFPEDFSMIIMQMEQR